MKRTCSNCGWVFPSSYVNKACRFCKTILDYQYCPRCDQWLPKEDFYECRLKGPSKGYCRKCSNDLYRESYARHRDKRIEYKRQYKIRIDKEMDALYDEWKKKLVTDIHPLTEEEWQEACRYFKGCAICGDPHIEIRSMFVLAKDGGKYNKTNVFPTCVKCGTYWRRSINPFRWLNKYFGALYTLDSNIEKVNNLVDYLKSKIEEVVHEGGMETD